MLEQDHLRTATDGHIPVGQCLDLIPGAAGNGSAATQPDIPERVTLEDLDAHASMHIVGEPGQPPERYCRQGSEWVAEWATGGEQPRAPRAGTEPGGGRSQSGWPPTPKR